MTPEIKMAVTEAEFGIGKELFLEYAGTLCFELCFQGFEQELADIRIQYAAPEGCLLLAYAGDRPVGCVGIRRWRGDIAELKRMYLKPELRGLGAGRILLESALQHARQLGYRSIRLDTLPTMETAIALYRAYDFHEIDPYRPSPIEGTLYLEKELD